SGWFTAEEAAVLNFGSLAKFFGTDLGRKIVANVAAVQRELPFTAGLAPADLVALKLEPMAGLPADEVVVVQGVVDLAVILEREIWIVDFKTDAVTELEMAAKAQTYEPQLKLYALALARIYNRPVTQCALYFLATGSLTLLSVA
ncbi:MAG TPA: PD-(D/E)XK nuclease family protein, partial [Candidatus Paceibacterota bacterium]|nr:PD-(D/E)XK nuclease family protein [Candidatus Paceibacterota bacterium]